MSRSIRLMLVVSLAASVSAWAGDNPRLMVVPVGASEGVPEAAGSKLYVLLLDELKSRSDFEVVAPPGHAKRGPPAEALAALEAGRKSFEDLRFEEATLSYKKGVERLLADPSTLDLDVLSEAYAKLAAAAFRLGEEGEAKHALLDLVRLAPRYQLPPGYPPIFQREFEKAKKRLEKLAKGQLSVDGPSGATVVIDGRDRGMVPVLEDNLAVGTHLVRVEGSKGERFGQTVEIKGGVAKVKATFAPASAAERAAQRGSPEAPTIGSSLDETSRQRVHAFAKAANADFALAVHIFRSGDTQLTAGAALYSVKKAAFVALAPIDFDTDVMTANTEVFKLAEEVSQQLGNLGALASLPLSLGRSKVTKTDKPLVSDEPDAITPGPSKKVSLVPKAHEGPVLVDSGPPPRLASEGLPPWVWVVVGVGVAAGIGVGTYAVIATASRPVTGTVTATW
jgi:PEGA domain